MRHFNFPHVSPCVRARARRSVSRSGDPRRDNGRRRGKSREFGLPVTVYSVAIVDVAAPRPLFKPSQEFRMVHGALDRAVQHDRYASATANRSV